MNTSAAIGDSPIRVDPRSCLGNFIRLRKNGIVTPVRTAPEEAHESSGAAQVRRLGRDLLRALRRVARRPRASSRRARCLSLSGPRPGAKARLGREAGGRSLDLHLDATAGLAAAHAGVREEIRT